MKAIFGYCYLEFICILVFGIILGGRASPEISYETSRGRNSEQIERRTSNAQHRTLNIDDGYALSILQQANGSLRRAQPNRHSKRRFAPGLVATLAKQAYAVFF